MKKFEKALIMAINLQLFANNEVQTTLLDSLSPEMKTYYDMNLIDEAGPNLVHDQFGQKKPIPKNGGKSIEFRKFSPLEKATTALTEGVTPDGKSLTVTDITATVAQYGDYIQQSDMLELTAIDNTILEATKLLGQQAGRTLDTVVRNVIIGGTNVSYASKVSNGVESAVTLRTDLDTTSKLKVSDIKKVVAKLKGQNAPKIDNCYVGIIHPYVAYDLMTDPNWIDVQKYATPENMLTGEIGKIAGVRFVETTEAKIYNDGSCPTKTAASGDDPAVYYSVFCTLILGANAYGVTEVEGGGLETIVKQKGSGGTTDPLNQRSTIGWKATKVAERLVENYMVRIESVSPDFATQAAN